MKYLILFALVLFATKQEKPIVNFTLNDEPLFLEKGISLSTLEGAYFQVELVEGEKIDPSLPVSGDIFIKADYMAAYMHEFENLEEKIYLLDSIRSKTVYRLKKGDELVVKLHNVRSEKDPIYYIPFRK
jgi:hypothetical protein